MKALALLLSIVVIQACYECDGYGFGWVCLPKFGWFYIPQACPKCRGMGLSEPNRHECEDCGQ